jgi:predicted transcriptional regulator
MKDMSNMKTRIDPIAEARKGKYFNKLSQEAKERIRLGVEIYNTREALKMSQQSLAKKAQTTQKVISRIESGDVNVGLALLNKIAKALEFDHQNWSRIFNFKYVISKNDKDIKKRVVFTTQSL